MARAASELRLSKAATLLRCQQLRERQLLIDLQRKESERADAERRAMTAESAERTGRTKHEKVLGEEYDRVVGRNVNGLTLESLRHLEGLFAHEEAGFKDESVSMRLALQRSTAEREEAQNRLTACQRVLARRERLLENSQSHAQRAEARGEALADDDQHALLRVWSGK